ncbi:hypothetical protein CULCOIPH002_06180 [Corynebacterium ulcerans]|uniref:hypothetical protein n=1 Tax=Corynebacterium ulcerans TaxID=65058 RepID=UPI0003C79B74|nr:hypothetical protein [Corynebacterium ulcerans]ESU59049.1 hypothetical protein D881_03095 [Corynebacterium ulcerans NCTC 12077]BDV25261.1 hypothetical protein CULTSU28_05090 [Corynebacterium ulcerans]GJJ33018.1 hypothetical protein CULCOIPH001_02260 [Corynebacterium ulcerans]GJJ35706.1 hypothetical protein CULCOIPH002_06180 [Corynebacterium ulcerans]
MNDSFMNQQWGTQTIHHGFVWFDTYEEATEARHSLAEYRKRNRIKLAPEEIEARWVTTAKREFGVHISESRNATDVVLSDGWHWYGTESLRNSVAEECRKRGCQVDLYTRFATEPEKQEW